MFRNGFDLFDDFFNDMYGEPYTKKENAERKVPQLMRTDVLEKDGQYLLDIELPGYSRDEVQAELKDGYLTIKASSNSENDAKDKDGKYIRRERYSGTCCRSFYVGEAVKQEDIRAKFEDGTLKLFIPRQDAKAVEDDRKYIAIEG